MKLYEKTTDHAMNNECFRMFVKRFQWVRFYQPQPQKAPWHWQASIIGQGPYDVLVNFWPHVAKAQREGEKSVEGWEAIRLLMAQIIDENGFDSGPELIE